MKFKKLDGGNCGMFSLALYNYAIDNIGVSPSIIIFSDYDGKYGNTPSSRDLLELELMIYHVALRIGNQIYDGSGITSIQNIKSWIVTEYNDNNPSINEYSKVDNSLISLITNDTNWDTSANKFYNFLIKK